MALALDHEIVVEPGAVPVAGVTEIEADTVGGALNVTVCEIVPERAPVESTASAGSVTRCGPVSVRALPESPSVPVPPPAKAQAPSRG
jgi:hypothetical protein